MTSGLTPRASFLFLGFIANAANTAGTLAASPAAHQMKPPKIELIEGSDSVQVVDSSGVVRTAKRGAQLVFGDRLKTSAKTAVVIAYADGTRLQVNPESDYQVEGPIRGTEWNRLRDGAVRGIVAKSPSASSRPKFLIRTKAATMGVRGTDFILALDPKTQVASVHTLEGIVDVAGNETSLLGGKGTQLVTGQAVEATQGSIGSAQSFDRKALLDAFDSGKRPSELFKTIGANTGSKGASVGVGAGAGGSPIGLGLGASGAGGAEAAPTSGAPVYVMKQAPNPEFAQRAAEADAANRAKSAERAKSADEADRARYADGGHRTKILNFQPAFFAAKEWGLAPKQSKRAFQLMFTPTIALPNPLWLYFRGAAGGLIQSGYKPFKTREFSVLIGTSILRPIYVEAGYGLRVLPDMQRPRLFTANIGWLSNFGGILDRVFIGTSKYQRALRDKNTDEIHVGLGIAF